MCCERLVCAHCAQPVADARCPACRASRAELHAQPRPSLATVAALAALLIAVALLLAGHVTA